MQVNLYYTAKVGKSFQERFDDQKFFSIAKPSNFKVEGHRML